MIQAEEIDEGRERFLHGECHLLAIALHELYAFPLGA